MKKINLYPYGFLFSENTLTNIPGNFVNIDLNDDYYFYYDPIVDMEYIHTSDAFIIVHGHFTYVNPDNVVGNKQLVELLFDSFFNNHTYFLNLLDYLAGRYVIIAGDKSEVNFYNDAAGTRSIYYSLTSSLVSSHANFIADNEETSQDNLVKGYRNLPKISTKTPFENIKSLLPNFTYELKGKSSKRFFPREENKFIKMKHEDKLALFENITKLQLKYYTENYKSIFHSITGGYDSRVSIALSKDYFDHMKFFTYTISRNKIKKTNNFFTRYEEDKAIVEQLISYLPINHSFLYLRDDKKKMSTELESVISKNTLVEHGRPLIPHYLDFVKSDYNIHIRGSTSAILKSPYLSLKEDRGVNFLSKKLISNIDSKLPGQKAKKLEDYVKEEILKYGYDKEIYGYHGLDLAYWEIRVGRFQSEVFNESDIAFNSLNLMNVRALFSLALAFDLEIRKSNYIFEEIINRNIPILNFFGKNQMLNLYEQNREELNSKHYNIEIYDGNDDIINRINKSSFYMPFNYFKIGNYSSIKYIFNKKAGFINLDLLNRYSHPKGTGYAKYEIYKNKKLLLSEDIAHWKFSNNISIFNLVKGDIIEIKIVVLRNVQSSSWERASRIHINDYQEVLSKEKHDVEVLSTSPFSRIE